MKKHYTTVGVALRIWLLTSIISSLLLGIIFLFRDPQSVTMAAGFVLLASIIGSIPAFVVVLTFLFVIKHAELRWQAKFFRLLFLQFGITACYGLFAAAINLPISMWFGSNNDFIYPFIFTTAILFSASCIATFIILKILAAYFSAGQTGNFFYSYTFSLLFKNTSKNKITMETIDHEQQHQPGSEQQTQSNKLLIKGLITGALILLMLIPTIFINNIIKEREQRQIEVVKEVSSKWASAQTLSGPYLVIPYADTSLNSDGKTIVVKKQLILLPNELNVDGKIFPEERPRSIYKVLLYKSNLKLTGSFKPKWPIDINPASIDFANARLCFGISDFKGIEEEIKVNFNNQLLPLTPGLPLGDLDAVGLSVPVSFNAEAINAGIPFDMQVKIKGSEQLHFMPLSANSKFSLSSTWASPSFDGNVLPNERNVTEKGFTAKWNFNQANLPFGTVLKEGTINKINLAFGVSMVQPADQYDKTMRCVKYAILFIGLTFALFFIIEIMQRKAFHPVQYVLVGLALVIFYTLLLAISEYILFDQAYLLAAFATVSLISLYAKSHFASWKTASIFFLTLGLLYGFIFILIRLEDTALLVGSIGLFIVLALVMYASRRINWYGKSAE
ncbi:MAG: cell envelope integrity protein CreD [Ferruginibacter sp.]